MRRSMFLAPAFLLAGSGLLAAQPTDFRSTGPFCARPSAIAAGPTPTAEAYLAVGGRLFRSLDGWLSWQEAGADLPVPDDVYLSSVAADPFDPRRLVFTVFSGGTFRSVDAGESWTPASDLPTDLFSEVWSAPAASGTFYAVDGVDGLYRSVDSGLHWQRIDPPSSTPNYLLFPTEPGPPGRLWLLSSLEEELWRSDDAGESWLLAGAGRPEGGIRNIVADPARPSVAYLTEFHRLWRTEDAETWTQVGGEIPVNTFVTTYSLLVLPGDPAILLAGQIGEPSSPIPAGPGLVRSIDGGLSWQPGGLVGETVFDLRYVPESGWAVAMTASGAFVSRDLGESWQRFGDGVNAARVVATAAAGEDHRRLLASVIECEGPRLALSDDGGRSWRLEPGLAVQPFSTFEVLDFAVVPSSPGTVYAGAVNGVWRSDDGGETWQHTPGPNDVWGLAVRPDDPDIVFAASLDTGLARSVDGGEGWQTGLLDALEIPGVFAVAVDPLEPQRVLAGGTGGLARSLDGGASWSRVPEVEHSVRGLAFDPGEPGAVVALTPFDPAPMIRSLDGGATWQPAGGGLDSFPLAVVFVPGEPGTAIAGTDTGLYRSFDGGATWTHWPESAGTLIVRDVAFDPAGRLLVATWTDGLLIAGPPGLAAECRPGPETACLLDGAFEVHGAMWDFETPTGERTLGVMELPGGRAESDQAVFFESFRPGNFELAVKMVDACGLPAGDPQRAYWAFFGGLTNAASEVVVEDTVTGAEHRWDNPAGSFPRSVGDTGAFPCVDGVPPAPCEGDAGTACLLGGRFRITGLMHDFSDPPQAVPARVMSFPDERAESNQAVFFDSFRPGNFELGVKMVDACGLPPGNPLRAYWAFYGGLTNAEASIVVTQLASGRTDRWSNPGGTFPLSEGRTAAFPCP